MALHTNWRCQRVYHLTLATEDHRYFLRPASRGGLELSGNKTRKCPGAARGYTAMNFALVIYWVIN